MGDNRRVGAGGWSLRYTRPRTCYVAHAYQLLTTCIVSRDDGLSPPRPFPLPPCLPPCLSVKCRKLLRPCPRKAQSGKGSTPCVQNARTACQNQHQLLYRLTGWARRRSLTILCIRNPPPRRTPHPPPPHPHTPSHPPHPTADILFQMFLTLQPFTHQPCVTCHHATRWRTNWVSASCSGGWGSWPHSPRPPEPWTRASSR